MAGQDCLNREGECERERPEEVGGTHLGSERK